MCGFVAVAGFVPASSIRSSISGRGLPAAANPRRAGGHPQHLQLQQLRQGPVWSDCWRLQEGPCGRPRGGLEDLVPIPELLIRRLLVENKSRVVCLTAIASSFVSSL